jgi:2-oxoglutarate ferredoxin oxidoreductase subunit alpha
VLRTSGHKTRFGVIYYGSTSPSMAEAIDALEAQGVHVDTLRLRAFPFPDSVADFIAEHEQCFVVEQNRDAQLRSLIVNELNVDPARVMPILHYDGTPITARFITKEVAEQVRLMNVEPLKKGKVA